MTPVRKITVTDIEVSISVRPDSNDYISLTDMAHFKDKDRTNYIIQNWMRLRSTIDFLGLWERLNNPDFKGIEFDAFKRQVSKSKRYIHLHRMAKEQLSHFNAIDAEKRFRTITDGNMLLE
ncbi:MAG: KilA-N domain-containing protein [Bacteroides sp.]|nr:KilA-N domain-containing protein [Bacteroides sp.]